MSEIPNLTHNGKTYVNVEPAYLLAQGVPQGTVDLAVLGVRVRAIKVVCRARIYAVASNAAQQNMTAAATLVSAKTASNRSAEEQALLLGLEAALEWVNAMRLAVGVIATDPAANPSDDASWPVCPPEVHTVVDQF